MKSLPIKLIAILLLIAIAVFIYMPEQQKILMPEAPIFYQNMVTYQTLQQWIAT